MNKIKAISYIFTLSFFILSCASQPQYNDPIPKHDSFSIKSSILNETRIINVWTPPSYQEGIDSFPVLYMADGGIKEDFPHIANTLAQLIERKSIPPVILVGIENTERGRDLTGFSEVEKDGKYNPLTDGAKNFRAFILDELVPEINQKYKVTKEKGIIGESLSGLFVMETFLLNPGDFDFYIAMDPSLWWNNNHLDKNAAQYLANFPDKKIRLWFASSSAGGMADAAQNIVKAIGVVKPPSLIWKYADEPKEKHKTIFRATKEKAIIWTLNAKQNE